MNWQAIVLPVAVAIATAIAANWFQCPKIKADVSKSETDEEVALRKLRLDEQVELLRGSKEARDEAIAAKNEAVTARQECERKSAEIVARLEAKYDHLAGASENLADAVQEMLDAPEDIVVRQTTRLRLREYRQAI